MFKFSITNDSISVIVEGAAIMVRQGQPNFVALRAALLADDVEGVRKNLTVDDMLSAWAGGHFTIANNRFSYDGKELPESLNKRIVVMATRGEDPTPFFLFWDRLQRNPSNRSVTQLFDFLGHCGIPLTKDGHFLAYKGVREDYKDQHTGSIDNHPGQVVKLPRNEISDDPDHGCHHGLHVGALAYAKGFAPNVVVVSVDPEHVVSVPKDSSFQKMRVCEYEVIGHYGAQLPDTVLIEDKVVGEPSGDAESGLDDEEEPCPNCGEIQCDGICDEEEEGDHFDGEVLPLPEQEELPLEKDTRPRLARRWQKLGAMSTRELLDQPIERLRQYAGKGLQIVGASKIPGGKLSLITRINRVRKKFQ